VAQGFASALFWEILAAMTHWGKVTGAQSMASSTIEPVSLQVGESDLPPIAEKERSITAGIRGLYQKCQMYDIHVVVGNSRLPAHKVVLAAMSEPLCKRVKQAVAEFQAQSQSSSPAVAPEEPKAAPVEPKETPEAQEAPPEVKEAPPAPAYDNQWSEVIQAAPAVPEAAGEGQEPQTVAEAAPAGKAQKAPSSTLTRPELNLEFITSLEAASVMLDMIYGVSAEDQDIKSDEANSDVLRLAKTLELPCLEGIAMKKLAKDLSTENVVPRLATCKQLGLTEMYEAIEEEVVINKPALVNVSHGTEVMQHPELLQSLLVRSAAVHRGHAEKKSNKRAIEEPPKRAEKAAKVSSGKAISGGA